MLRQSRAVRLRASSPLQADPSLVLGPKLQKIWESWIELGEKFYEAVTLSSVPVDLRALRALKRSPLALDLYAWLTYTAFVATKARRPSSCSDFSFATATPIT